MKPSAEVLFKLLRTALGNEFDYSLPNAVDWNGVYRLSSEQGVVSIAVDGLHKIYELNANIDLDLDKPELERLKYEWYGMSFVDEQNYCKISSVAKQISSWLHKVEIRTLLVKGLAYASYYPVPQHRSFGDIDIFSPLNYQQIDGVLKPVSMGFSLDYYRHSHCSVCGVTVENHKYLCDIRGQKRWALLEAELNKWASEILASKPIGGLYYPDSKFSIIFFLYHAQAHLIFEKLSLRFLADWVVLLKGEVECMSAEWFADCIKQYNLGQITRVLTTLCVRYLGISTDKLPDFLRNLVREADSELENKVMIDIFRDDNEGFGNSSLYSRLKRSLRMFCKDRWKFKEFLGVTPERFVLEKAWGIVSDSLMFRKI